MHESFGRNATSLSQSHAVNPPRDDVGAAVRRLTPTEITDDARDIDLRRLINFSKKRPLGLVIPPESFPQELDGNDGTVGLHRGAIDFAEPARADELPKHKLVIVDSGKARRHQRIIAMDPRLLMLRRKELSQADHPPTNRTFGQLQRFSNFLLRVPDD